MPPPAQADLELDRSWILPEAELPAVAAPLIVRRRDGRVHPGIALVRLAMGFPPGL